MLKFYNGKEVSYLEVANERLTFDSIEGSFRLLESAVPCARGVTFDLVLEWAGWRGIEKARYCVFLAAPRRDLRAFAARVAKRGLVEVLVMGEYTSRPVFDTLAGRVPQEQFTLPALVERVAPEVWAQALEEMRPRVTEWAAAEAARKSMGQTLDPCPPSDADDVDSLHDLGLGEGE